MDSEPAEKTEKSIADLVAEYKSAFLHGDRFLEGFGTFLTIDTIGSARKEQRREAEPGEKKDYQSEPFLDTEIGPKYFESLANIEWEMFGAGKKYETMGYVKLIGYIDGFVDLDIDWISEDPKKAYLGKCNAFRHAWFDDMLRAGIKGLKRAGCEITAPPVQYSEKQQEKASSSDLEQKMDLLDKKIDDSLKRSSHFKNYLLAGIAGLYFLAAAAGTASVVFIQNTKKEIDYRISSAYDNAIINAETVFRQRIDAYLNSCAPDVGKDLPLEERLPLVFNMLKDDAKKELVQTVATEGMPLFEARYGQPISEEKIVQNIIDAIKSGRITISDLFQAPDKKNE